MSKIYLFAIACILILLCACTRTQVEYRPTAFSMPAKPDSDFRCDPEPSVAHILTDEDDASYKADLRLWGLNACSRLGAAGEAWRSTEAALEASKSRAIPPKEEGK